MKQHEWTVIQTLLSLELDMFYKRCKFDKDALDDLYFRFKERVERHIRLTDEVKPEIIIVEEEKVG